MDIELISGEKMSEVKSVSVWYLVVGAFDVAGGESISPARYVWFFERAVASVPEPSRTLRLPLALSTAVGPSPVPKYQQRQLVQVVTHSSSASSCV